MKILITGSTGLVGTQVVRMLEAQHDVVRLVRESTKSRTEQDAVWDPNADSMDLQCLEDADAVVHLAGENLGRRWNPALKQKIRDSRINGTRLLSESIAKCSKPPKVLIAASAIGYYGSRGDEEMVEASSPGSGFLADVVADWEAATSPASEAGIRVVNLRTGVVLSNRGGAIHSMMRPFKLCLGGIVGNGRQYWSWIEVSDVARIVAFALNNESISGPLNTVAPVAVTNREFTKAFGRVISRPTIFPMPAFLAKLVLGEMGEELLLSSTRVVPQKLLEAGFEYGYPELDGALRNALTY